MPVVVLQIHAHHTDGALLCWSPALLASEPLPGSPLPAHQPPVPAQNYPVRRAVASSPETLSVARAEDNGRPPQLPTSGPGLKAPYPLLVGEPAIQRRCHQQRGPPLLWLPPAPTASCLRPPDPSR